MRKPRPQRRDRDSITQLAARLVAQDGVADLGVAKRKAARQLGLPENGQLPSNEEVEAAVRSYQAIYLADAHPAELRRLRRLALDIMESLDRYSPYLTGAVLNGAAGPQAEIQLQLFADSEKEVEMDLLDRRLAYRRGERRVLVGEEARAVPTFSFSADGTDVTLSVFSSTDERAQVRGSHGGRPVQRARAAALRALLIEEAAQP